MPLWLFILLAVIAVVSALGVVIQANPVHCLLTLAVNLVDIGVLFIGLGAVTVGLLQIIIYVSAIMVLFLYVIWLLNLQPEIGPISHLAIKALCAIGAAVLAAELCLIFSQAAPVSKVALIPSDYGSIERLGRLLFSEYAIAFEVTSILLLAAIVGAIGLARRIPAAQSSGGVLRPPPVQSGETAAGQPERMRRAG